MVVFLPFNKMRKEWTEPKGKYKLKHPGNSEQQEEELVPIWEGEMSSFCGPVSMMCGVCRGFSGEAVVSLGSTRQGFKSWVFIE